MEKVVLKGSFEGSKDRHRGVPSDLRIAKLIKRVLKNKSKKKRNAMG